MQVEHALNAIIEGWSHKGTQYPAIGLGDYKIGGKSFSAMLTALCTEVEHQDADRIKQAIKADQLLNAASQVCSLPARPLRCTPCLAYTRRLSCA